MLKNKIWQNIVSVPIAFCRYFTLENRTVHRKGYQFLLVPKSVTEIENKFLGVVKKKNNVIIIAILIFGVILVGYLTVYFMSCIMVDYITLEVELPWEIRTKLTKDCYNEQFLSIVSQNVIDEAIDLKVEYLRLLYLIDSSKREIEHLENQIEYSETFPREQWTSWMKENIPKMKNELDYQKEILKNSEKKLPEITRKLEEKLESITVAVRTDTEKEEITSQIDAIKAYPLIVLDQQVYTWTDKVYITIVDLNSDKDSNQVEVIGGNKDRPLTVETKKGFMKNTMLVETGYDTGIFTLEIILTGFFPYDVDGDGNLVDVPTRYSDFGMSGFAWLPAGRGDLITVSYEFLEGKKVRASAEINWNIAEIQSIEYPFQVNNYGTIRLIDPDVNLNPEEIDQVSIRVTSSSDSDGILLVLTETNEATAIFEGSFFISDLETNQMKDILLAKPGDNVTSIYEDRTLPKPYDYGDSLKVTSVTQVN